MEEQAALFALMELGAGAAYIFAPESVIENVDLQAKGVTCLIQMWAARQFALGFVFGYAVFKRSASMHTLAYLFFFIHVYRGLFYRDRAGGSRALWWGGGDVFDICCDELLHQ